MCKDDGGQLDRRAGEASSGGPPEAPGNNNTPHIENYDPFLLDCGPPPTPWVPSLAPEDTVMDAEQWLNIFIEASGGSEQVFAETMASLSLDEDSTEEQSWTDESSTEPLSTGQLVEDKVTEESQAEEKPGREREDAPQDEPMEEQSEGVSPPEKSADESSEDEFVPEWRKRKTVSVKMRRKMRRFKDQNPKATHAQIGKVFGWDRT
jgi:hypothetical protein